MAHYDQVAESYEDAFFYARGEYQEHLVQQVSQHLDLESSEAVRLVDLGGGTGNFTQALVDANALQQRPLCVDPYQEMLDQATSYPAVDTYCRGAVEFADEADRSYDRVLLKEMVHHVPEEQLAAMYAGLGRQLAPGGVMLTCTRPQEVDYPLFTAARQVWRDNQPAHSLCTDAMETAGLQVEVVEVDYTVRLPKAQWFRMVRARFWSTFSHFTDEQLEKGIAELELLHADSHELRFVDRMLFLVGRRTCTKHTERHTRGSAGKRGKGRRKGGGKRHRSWLACS